MKVFKFYQDGNHYAFAAQTKELAIQAFKDEISETWDSYEEVPESKWDKKMIDVYEDNDTSKEPFKISILEAISGTEPQLIFTNDLSIF